MERKRRRRVEALIGSWSFFVFWMFLFGIIGILVADWFTVASWWIWLIGGMAFIGAVAETIRFTAMKRGKRKRLESLIGSWSFFLFFVLLFYVIGIEAAGWWTYDAWWVWLILGLSFMGTISTTIRFFVYRHDDVQPVPETTTIQTPEPIQPEKGPKFCQSCGQQVEGTEKFCANCGAPVE